MAELPTDWTWADFPRDDVTTAGFVRLPRHGWYALVAFLAGPRAVHAVTEERKPVRWSSSDGSSGTRARTAEDLDELEEALAEYLSHAGVEPPPRDVEWRLDLPEGMTEEAFWGRAHAAVDPVEYGQPGAGPRAAARLRDELEAILSNSTDDPERAS